MTKTISENGIIGTSADFGLEIAKGNIKNYSSEFKFARNEDITSTEQVIWDAGGDYVWLDTAEKMLITSSSGLDVFDGTGARTGVIFGLDNDYEQISELFTFTGATPVLTDNSYLRVHRVLVLTSGTNSAVTDANKGIINVKGAVSTAVTFAQIKIGHGQTLMSPYTIPAGKTGYITGASFSAGEGKQCTFRGKIRNTPTSDGSFSIKYILDLFGSAFTASFTVPLKVPEKTDMCFTGQTTQTSIDASASYGIILIDN
jgi:hypothetical protein